MLCAYLALPSGGAYPRERLAHLFWGDRADEQARGSLRNALASIRRLLGHDVLNVSQDSIAFDPQTVDVDAERFATLIEENTPDSLAQAAALYRGSLLEGYSDNSDEFDAWLRRERQRLDDVALSGFTSLLRRHVESKAYQEGLEIGRLLLAVDPMQEETHRLLMRLYADHDQQPLALRQYEDVARLLANELGIEPSAATQALARQIRSGREAPDSDAPASDKPMLENDVAKAVLPVDRPSLAVLPFAALGHDDQDHFADGVVEEITAAFSRVRSLFVIARNSALAFRDTQDSVSAISEKLGVRYLLTGSVRRAAGRIRIATQLLDAESSEQLWTEQFEGGDTDIFDLQDRITEEVVGILQPTILAAEIRRARRKRPESLQAYDMVHRSFPHLWEMTFEDNQKAQDLLSEAIRLDPTYALAHALLSWAHAQNITYNWTGDIAPAKEKALSMAREAFRLDSGDPMVLAMLSTAESLAGDNDIARVHIDRALSIDRNSAWAWMRSGYIHCYDGLFERAIENFERAWRLSPFDPLNFNLCFGMGLSFFGLGQFEKAAKLIEQGLLENPSAVWANRPLVAIYAWMDEQDKADAATERVLARYPDLTVSKIMNSIPHRNPVMAERYTQGLIKAGFPQ